MIVHAGDPDEEGQLLVEELLEYTGNRKPVKRLLINDNTAAVKKALSQLKDNHQFKGIYRKALARAAGDLIYGMSMTRAYTIAGRKRLSERLVCRKSTNADPRDDSAPLS